MNDDIKDLKEAVNSLTIQLSAVSVENQLLRSLLFGVMSEKFPDIFPALYSNYVDQLEQDMGELLNKVSDVLFDTGDSAFVIRQKMDLFEAVQAMKNDKDYVSRK